MGSRVRLNMHVEYRYLTTGMTARPLLTPGASLFAPQGAAFLKEQFFSHGRGFAHSSLLHNPHPSLLVCEQRSRAVTFLQPVRL